MIAVFLKKKYSYRVLPTLIILSKACECVIFQVRR